MSGSCDIVVMGGSWGGMHAVAEILGVLPRDFPAPILVVLHRAEGSQDLLASLLDARCPLEVRDAEDKARLGPGSVLLAPPGYHALVERGHVALSTEAAVRHSRPSIDLALESASAAYGAGVVGIVLTGANADGAEGLAYVRRRGGYAIVQDPETAERRTMPAAALAVAHPQEVLPLDQIGPWLVRLVSAVRP